MQLSCYRLPEIQTPLVNKFYQANRVRGRATKQDTVWVTKSSELIAACRVQNVEQYAFLSTVFVATAYRGQGVAKRLLLCAIESQECVYTFAYRTIAPLYSQLNFVEIDQLTLPTVLREKFVNYTNQGREIIAMCFQRTVHT
ncbi:GNAT family N-acetyltransferase [Pseudoalteromonas obscura]|uniref:GNAT family N-acetyltransferase n=1 Tax=Pseudoalteromonas obscura TaxID=3048491 RepID=A0ABT7EMZ2_9GAMM|nr:GNAT family N-acetyltransferase [Pseudoalteromonas sp. P94(2023)]MDK2596422.1 GNAT family N-acetyltransferase [Pseudoalteromonas sp. P94(2023)]